MTEPRVDTMLTTTTTGLDIHYRDWGGEGPPIVLVHGLASTCRIFDLCAPLLARQHRVVAYDQRGHGYTAKPPSGYDVETLIADGVGVTRALGLAPPFTVVGHSWGASVALEWAARHPADVQAAVLVDGTVFNFRDLPGATWETIAQRFAPPDLRGVLLEDLLDDTRRGDLDFLDDDFRRAFFGSIMHLMPDGSIHARLSREHHLQILRTLWDEDLGAAFRAVRCPTLALIAVPDRLDEPQQQVLQLKRQTVPHLQALSPLLRVRWLEQTVHDIPLQRPAMLAEAVSGLSRQGTADGEMPPGETR